MITSILIGIGFGICVVVVMTPVTNWLIDRLVPCSHPADLDVEPIDEPGENGANR